ncbi:hypothetical protein [Natrinema pallidum]|uniref:hypothetical protein n=1 Tax=Natrinema pallidum TaxID=69527 RepID=UPI0037503A15
MELDNDFEQDLGEALLDDIEQRARDEIAPELESQLRDRIRDYGTQNDYDVRALLAGLEVEVTRTSEGVWATARLPDPAILFERGTVDHEVHARNADVLSFIWEKRHDPPEWVREEYDREGDGWRVFLPSVSVSGLPEGRFIRDTLNEIRRQLKR